MNAMLRRFLEKWVVYIYSCLAAVIAGIAHSVAPMIVDPQKFNLGEGLHNLEHIASVSAIIGVVTYLLKSPIPSLPKGFGEDTEIVIKQQTDNNKTVTQITSTSTETKATPTEEKK